MVVLGVSPNRPVTEEARIAGLAWERLPDPTPQLIWSFTSPVCKSMCFTSSRTLRTSHQKEIDLLHSIWLQLSNDVAPEEIHHHDVLHYALERLNQDLSDPEREEVLRGL